MERSRILNKKIWGIIFFALSVVLLIFILRSNNGKTLYLSPVLAQNVQNRFSLNEDVYFFTGHGFAKFNINDQRSTSLTPFLRLPKMSEVQISSSRAIFETQQTSSSDDLHKILVEKNLDPNKSWWWQIDFNTDKITLIGEREGFSENISAIALGNNSLIVATEQMTNKPAKLYRESGFELKEIYSLPKGSFISIFGSDSRRVVFSSRDEIASQSRVKVFSFDSKETIDLPEVIKGDIEVSSDLNTLLFQPFGIDDAADDKYAKQGLYSYRIGDEEPKLLIEGFYGSITPDSSGSFFVSGSTNNQRYDAKINHENMITKLNISNPDENLGDLFLSPTGDNLDKVIGVDGQEKLYLLSTNSSATEDDEKVLVPDDATQINNSSYSISYLEPSNSFSILITKLPFKANLDNALDELEGFGVDTNQHQISANPIRGLEDTQTTNENSKILYPIGE